MGQVFNTWMSNTYTAETSKTVMDELDMISLLAGTIMNPWSLRFPQCTSVSYPQVIAETFGSCIMAG